VKYKQTLAEQGIIRIVVSDDVILDLEDIMAMRAVNLLLSQGGFFCILWDSRGVHFSIESDALKQMGSSAFQEKRKAAAIVVDSLAGKLVGNFFKSLSSQKSPSRIFNSEEEALKWLRGF
jgi:hypothetical protein